MVAVKTGALEHRGGIGAVSGRCASRIAAAPGRNRLPGYTSRTVRTACPICTIRTIRTIWFDRGLFHRRGVIDRDRHRAAPIVTRQLFKACEKAVFDPLLHKPVRRQQLDHPGALRRALIELERFDPGVELLRR